MPMKKISSWLMLASLWLCASVAHAGTVTYVYTDPQGTPLAEADASGNITARFEYTPYGVSVPSMGAAPNGVGYTGHVNDPETGLVYMQARYYDAEVGRFLSVDPVATDGNSGNHFNRYWYADDNPTKFTDPDGRCANLCTAAVGVGVGALVGLAVEGYSQVKAGKFDGRSLLVETGKGAVVGGLIGLTGGAVAASGMTLGAQAATTGTVAFGVGTGAHTVGEVAKGNAAPSVSDSMKVGAATAVGAIAGTAISPVTSKLTTSVIPAVSSHPVTSLSGKVFNTVNIPAQTVTRPVVAEALNNAAAAAVEDSAKRIK